MRVRHSQIGKGGNDTIEFLREKPSIDKEMKQEDQKGRREEHERQARLYELALANQQQQQQQSNQLVSLMIERSMLTRKHSREILIDGIRLLSIFS